MYRVTSRRDSARSRMSEPSTVVSQTSLKAGSAQIGTMSDPSRRSRRWNMLGKTSASMGIRASAPHPQPWVARVQRLLSAQSRLRIADLEAKSGGYEERRRNQDR